MAHTRDVTEQQQSLDFADSQHRGRYGWVNPFGLRTCKFSADGDEVVAGGTQMLFGMHPCSSIVHRTEVMACLVYDLVADKRSVKFKAHEDDINSCCWTDTAGGNVLVSASNDTFLKVWYVPRFSVPLNADL